MNRLLVLSIAFCMPSLIPQGHRIVEAGIVVTILDRQLSPSESSFIDVMIRSDSNDTLTNFSFDLHIQQSGTTSTQLRFSTLQSDSQLSNPDYVFAGGSLKRDGDPALLIDPEAVGSAYTELYPRDSFVGTDSHTLLVPSSITLTSTDRLLARLELESGPGFLAPAAGDRFVVTLVDGPFTTFLDENFSEVSYVSSPGTITVSVVPEPGSFVSMLIGIAVACCQCRRAVAARTKL